MTKDEIISRSDKLIDEHLLGGRKPITPTSEFHEDFDADSLDMVELVMAFEEEFDIEITDDEGEKIVVVGDAYALVESKLA